MELSRPLLVVAFELAASLNSIFSTNDGSSSGARELFTDAPSDIQLAV